MSLIPARPLPEDPNNHWSFDKRIPLALIATLTIQALVLISGGAIAYYRLGEIADRVKTLEDRDRADMRDQAAREIAQVRVMTELDGAVKALRETVADLRGAVRVLEGRLAVQQGSNSRTPPN